ncbi:MAG: tRNA lysidine(34) synthetase TilS [Rhodobacterales bacterium]|nr:tRNA lysidine(34) synthetase TilS [Rhodobacterales bacterium]MDX5500391.1 tRNA lysidine(34) synthetase TilS [Rhodobacterales bacterium]
MSAAEAAVARAFAAVPHRRPVAIAVSGGGDSMALLDLAIGAARGIPVQAVTLDHGLRPEAAAEAATVAAFCAGRGISHTTLRWTGWDGSGNLQAEARAARYRLIGSWAAGQGIGQVWLGHTRDDVAETFLIRLGRASGLEGLARMAPAFQREGMAWVRPLLDIARADLRAHLCARGLGWVEDPSNLDDGYARVRVRKALDVLAGIGLTPEAIAHSAAALDGARGLVADHMAGEWAARVTLDRGDLLIRTDGAGAEVLRRLLVAGLRLIGGQDWAPRHAALVDLTGRLARQGRHTLSGCLITRKGDMLRIAREWQAVRGLEVPSDAEWDGRWSLDGPHAPGLTIRALGQGIGLCPDWRGVGLPRASLMAGPAVWAGKVLIAAPLAGLCPVWTARLRPSFAMVPFAH